MTSLHIVSDHRRTTFDDNYVSLATTEGQIEADCVLPNENTTHHTEYLLSDEHETAVAELHRKYGDVTNPKQKRSLNVGTGNNHTRNGAWR